MRRRGGRRGGAALLVTVAAACGGLAATRLQETAPPRAAARALSLPPPVAPAFTPGRPRALGPARYRTLWAPVRRAVAVRRAPSAGAREIARLDTTTPEGTDAIVTIAGRALDARGRPWVRVRLAVLPNGTTGWVPRSALGGYNTVETRLVVSLRTLTATLYRDGRVLLRAPVGVGASATPTPVGEFYVRNRLTRYSSPVYGPVAFGTSARSPQATDWPAGGYVGIHGTDQPQLIPGRISHGCIRLRNADILALSRLMPVGTPVAVR